jgi:hypothetical protein
LAAATQLFYLAEALFLLLPLLLHTFFILLLPQNRD